MSEIGEEPIHVLSTDRDGDGSPSVEPEISRISSHNDVTALHNQTAGVLKEPLESLKEQEEEKLEAEEHLEQPFMDLMSPEGESLATARLPPSTKKYTLVLDLDETLIHSHVQYKKPLTTKT